MGITAVGRVHERVAPDWRGTVRAGTTRLRPAAPRYEPAHPDISPRRAAIRVAVLAEDRLVRDKLSALVNRLPDLEAVVSTATTAHVAVVNAVPVRGISRCVERARELVPGARVVVMNAPAERAELVACIREGARGFTMADATVDEFVGAIREVAGGASVLPGVLAPLLFEHLVAEPPERAPNADHGHLVQLTAREREVVALVQQGLANKVIAVRLGVAVHTVKTHMHNILQKLSLGSRLQLAVRAHRSESGAGPNELRSHA